MKDIVDKHLRVEPARETIIGRFGERNPSRNIPHHFNEACMSYGRQLHQSVSDIDCQYLSKIAQLHIEADNALFEEKNITGT